MSRIGKIPVVVPQGVQVCVEGRVVKAKGLLGELQETLPAEVTAAVADGKVRLTADIGSSAVRALYGTSRARIANIVIGVQGGFSKILDIVGLGFKAQIAGEKLTLNLGKSHPVEYAVPKGVKIAVDAKTYQITITGADKGLVGSTAAAIRAIRPPEPYKGTGIRYHGEYIPRKAGKTAAGAGAGGAAGAKK